MINLFQIHAGIIILNLSILCKIHWNNNKSTSDFTFLQIKKIKQHLQQAAEWNMLIKIFYSTTAVFSCCSFKTFYYFTFYHRWFVVDNKITSVIQKIIKKIMLPLELLVNILSLFEKYSIYDVNEGLWTFMYEHLIEIFTNLW